MPGWSTDRRRMSDTQKPPRPGEVVLDVTPGAAAAGPSLEFIGEIRTPWGPDDCPRNLIQARETGAAARVILRPEFRPGLLGLEPGQHVILLYWMDRARRDLIRQNPRHGAGLRGAFALRSPIRPNPVSLATVRITTLDAQTGELGIDAIDCFDRTPLLDIKPWKPGIDIPDGRAP